MSTYHVTVNGQVYAVELRERRGPHLTFAVSGTEYSVSVEQAFRPTASQPLAVSSAAVAIRPAAAAPALLAHEVRSPIPGIVSDVKVAVGESVEAGATLLVIEAMKMENPIKAPCSGVVASVHVSKGEEVGNAALLVSFENAE